MNRLIATAAAVLILFTSFTTSALASETYGEGAVLFGQHCAGCHVNGGNIIRRGKNLKLATLQRQGLDSTEAIASIARNGIGQMSGYSDSTTAASATAQAATNRRVAAKVSA